MTQNNTPPKCGNCVFRHPLKQDLTKGVCKGAPPQVVIMPTQAGPAMQFHYPLVETQGDPCAFHKMKTLIDTPEENA